MPYQIQYTDKNNKNAIDVFDNTSNKTDTSLTFPGRNVTGYGAIIAENFLHLLENFASGDEPTNPVEGQLWYNSADAVLQLWDNTGWKAASNIQKGPSAPDVEISKVGELWVDTTNQQLRIFSGTRWILVGPSESSVDGLRYGPVIERISDSDNFDRTILTFYIGDVPVIIFSKDTFTPKVTLSGYTVIKAGMNINSPGTPGEASTFEGGLLPKLYGTSLIANALTIDPSYSPDDPAIVVASKFLRSDAVNTTEFGFNIANNSGLTLGVDRTFSLSTTETSAKIYNKSTGSSIDLQTNRDGSPSTILRIIDNKVGINNETPDEALDVDGNFKLNGTINIANTNESTNLSNGSLKTLGGIAVAKNIRIGTTLDVAGISRTTNIQPQTTDVHDLGSASKRWNKVIAKEIVADTITGVLQGNISGNANTATNLKNVTSFQLAGDVTCAPVEFDGQKGSYTKIFNTSLTANIISSKDEPFPIASRSTDFILTYRASAASLASSGLYKQTRDNFIGDLGLPIGTILPYAGVNLPAGPDGQSGFLFCDGAEVEIAKYQTLYDIIGTTYNGSTPLIGFSTFRLPDLRGRFALGRDNMDNATTVPLASGTYVDAGGGAVNRVPGTKAQTLGGDAGQSSATLTLTNLPPHTHSLQNNGVPYYAIRVDTAINPPATTGLGPTAPGAAQYFNNSGPVTTNPDELLSQPIGIMNPYLTINYIIRSGLPAFTTTIS